MEAETRASAVAAGIREAVPEGHHYLPARPYPPERIPEEELVPMTPEPFNRVKDMPVSELVYDEELDEFVVPKGYVSEDEMIDDQSVVWHPENHTVACKFRGEEEPVISGRGGAGHLALLEAGGPGRCTETGQLGRRVLPKVVRPVAGRVPIQDILERIQNKKAGIRRISAVLI